MTLILSRCTSSSCSPPLDPSPSPAHSWVHPPSPAHSWIHPPSPAHSWIYPDFYFSKEVTTKYNTKILIVSIDTWRLNGGDTYVSPDSLSPDSLIA